MLKNFIASLLAIAVGVAIICGIAFFQEKPLGNYNPQTGINTLDYISGLATTTESYCAACPTKVLNKANSRQWAYISTDSAAGVYLYFASDELSLNMWGEATAAGLVSATGTITTVSGLFNLASTTNKTFVIDLSNQFNGQIWATTTADTGAATINVVYTQ